jgi:outer membrane protein assembly factor BamB
VCALELNGRVAWQYRATGPVYACPAFAGGAVIVTTNGGRVVALDSETGKLQWEHVEEGSEFDTSVAVGRSTLYAAAQDGKLLYLDPADGSVNARWLSPTGNAIHSSPSVGAGDAEGMVFLGSDDSYIYVLSASSPQTIACHQTNGQVLSSPAGSGSIAYVTSDGSLYSVGPQAHEFQQAYSTPPGVRITTSAAAGDGLIVFGASDGYLYALQSQTRDTA